MSKTKTTGYIPSDSEDRRIMKASASTAKVRKWEDTEWVAPTREYLGLEDK